jgi:putative flippase GtrA
MKKKEQFIKATIVSVITTAIDLTIFRIISNNSHSLLIIAIATLISRTVSTILMYIWNKKWVFKSNKKAGKEFIEFVIMIIIQIIISAFFVWLLRHLPLPQIVTKMLVDTLLFFLAYFTQKYFIFKEKEV